MPELLLSTDPTLLDPDFIHGFITDSYWAKGRSRADMLRCMDHSLNFGLYLDSRQAGYARLLTDYVQFAYLMDVFIDPAFRGQGYSKALMQYILEHEALQQIRVWRLATTDAHDLYRQFGFKPLASPEKMMELVR
jgi:GNAT superfamily N-acetyltransferase